MRKFTHPPTPVVDIDSPKDGPAKIQLAEITKNCASLDIALKNSKDSIKATITVSSVNAVNLDTKPDPVPEEDPINTTGISKPNLIQQLLQSKSEPVVPTSNLSVAAVSQTVAAVSMPKMILESADPRHKPAQTQHRSAIKRSSKHSDVVSKKPALVQKSETPS